MDYVELGEEAVRKNALEKVRISLERETRESSRVFL